MKTVTIYTDGACSGNPGPGGWGANSREIYLGRKEAIYKSMWKREERWEEK